MNKNAEQTFTVGIVGNNYEQQRLIGQALGSPDSTSDIQVFERFDSSLGQIFCALTPVEYPKKLKPLLQVLMFSDIHLIVIDLETELNQAIGEIFVAADIFHKYFNSAVIFVVTNITQQTEWKLERTIKKIQSIMQTTSFKNSPILTLHDKADYKSLKKEIIHSKSSNTRNSNIKDYTKVLVDHAFPVKGIGTVALGLVKTGSISVDQMVEIVGYKGNSKKAMVKNIQKHERNFKSADTGDRIGLALKGKISPKDLNRDSIIVSQGVFQSEKKVEVKVYMSEYFKPKGEKVTPNSETQYTALVETKTTPFTLLDGDILLPGKTGQVQLEFGSAVYHDGSGLKGLLVDLNQFTGKSRILGYFEQL